MSSRRFLARMSGRQSADWLIKSKQWFLASYSIVKNFELSGTIIRVLDPQFQNGTHFWKAEGQLYKMDTKPENRPRHDPTLNLKLKKLNFLTIRF